MTGVDLVLGILMLLVLQLTGNVLVAIPFLLWSLAASGFILHRAMSVDMTRAVGIALLIAIASYSISSALATLASVSTFSESEAPSWVVWRYSRRNPVLKWQDQTALFIRP